MGIDVAVLYTKNLKEDIYIDPDTKIKSNIFTIVNEIFDESKTGIQFNVVHYEELDYENNCIEDRCTPEQTGMIHRQSYLNMVSNQHKSNGGSARK